MTEFLLCLFGGFFGLHKFYQGKTALGLVYLFTGGLFGIGWLIDTIILATNISSKNTQAKAEIERKKGFPETMPGYFLRWFYNDVPVVGVQYQHVNFYKIIPNGVVTFELDPLNQYDPNAVKVIHNKMHIGYIRKESDFQDMINSYLNHKKYLVKANIESFNAQEQRITLRLGFYMITQETKEEPV